MKKLTLSIAALAMVFASNAQTLDRSIRPKPGAATEIKLKDAKSFTLPNGMKVFVVENNKVPTVSYSILLNIEPIEDKSKAGLSDFMGSLLTAGTKTLDKEKFDEQIDLIGGSISASGSSITGYSMTKHQDKLLSLMSDALINPNFQESELDKLKKQAESGLESSKNEPDAMLQNVKRVINYGTNHTYGYVTTPQTVNNVSLQDCNDYYASYFRPNVAYMAVVGDVKFAQVKKMVTKYFSKWEKANVPVNKYPVVKAPDQSIVRFVPREGSVQSVIGVTYPVDLQPGTEDVIKARILNEILGGSSQGRLFLNLREKHGWTYGSYSSLDNNNIVGEFQAYAKARNAVTDSSVNEILAEMNRIKTELVPAEELQNIKNYISGVFAIGLESPSTIARYAIYQDMYNMPKDYYKNYLKNVSAVSSTELKNTAIKYIKPDNANIIVVGSMDEAKKLERYSKSPIKFYDNYGAEIKPEAEKAVATDITADVIKAKYIKAIGGQEAIIKLSSLVVESEMTMGPQKVAITNTVVSPNQLAMVVNVPGMGEVQKIVYNNGKGYMKSMGNKQDIPSEALGEFADQANLQRDIKKTKDISKDVVKGIQKVDGKDCYVVVEFAKEGEATNTHYYDVATGLLLKTITVDPATSSSTTTTYSDYKEVKNGNGYKVPFVTKVSSAQGAQEINIKSAIANGRINDAVFQ